MLDFNVEFTHSTRGDGIVVEKQAKAFCFLDINQNMNGLDLERSDVEIVFLRIQISFLAQRIHGTGIFTYVNG